MNVEASQIPASDADTVLPLKVDRSEVFKTERSFMNLNRLRLARVKESVGQHKAAFFQLLPLLFHTNHPLMPGYVDKDCPSGVSDYTPNTETLRAASRLARSFSIRKGAVRRIDIQSIFLMGSSGSIAQSSDSDFDLWLCHRPGLTSVQIAKLRKKAIAVENWAAGLGLEVHFFLMNPDTFKAGTVEQLSSESSGTAQRYLLLDEFYRTGLLVQGRPPLWWLVPPDMESEYDDFIATMIEHRFINAEDYVDFGTVTNIEPAEFLGATLWQLTKAIDSPHKSLLKIMLLEAYASDYPVLDLLSARFKRAVYAGDRRADKLDPYLLLYNKVEEYLSRLGDQQRLDLARRCLYFKAGRSRSQIASHSDWGAEMMAPLVEAWEWSEDTLSTLDERHRWKVDRTLVERKTVVDALTRGYKQLSRFAREHGLGEAVSTQDMTILGRKLFTAFEHKAGKIDMVNHGISKDLCESHLYFERVTPEQGRRYWLGYRQSQRDAGTDARQPLKRTWSLVELLAWCHFNGLLDTNTRMVFAGDASGRYLRQAETVCAHLARYFPAALSCCASIDTLSHPASLVVAGTFVNFDMTPVAETDANAKVITTDRSDALSYSAWHANLVHELDYLVVTSWGEILVKKFEDAEGLMSCLCEHLEWNARSRPQSSRAVISHCCGDHYSDTITRRIAELFRDVSRWFTLATSAPRHRYVVRTGDRYHALICVDRAVRHEFSGSYPDLLVHLEQPNPAYTATTFDAHALDDNELASVLAANNEGVVQFFYTFDNGVARIYVLDEHGALLCDRLENVFEETLVGHYVQFFESVQYRQASGSDGAGTDSRTTLEVRYCRLRRGRGGRCLMEPVNQRSSTSGQFFNLQVIGERVGPENSFTVYCDGREFSTREHGSSLFAVVSEHMLAQRRHRGFYPIYVTDVDLSALADQRTQQQGLQTIHYLHYKKRIEHWLNRFLEQRLETSPPVWDPSTP